MCVHCQVPSCSCAAPHCMAVAPAQPGSLHSRGLVLPAPQAWSCYFKTCNFLEAPRCGEENKQVNIALIPPAFGAGKSRGGNVKKSLNFVSELVKILISHRVLDTFLFLHKGKYFFLEDHRRENYPLTHLTFVFNNVLFCDLYMVLLCCTFWSVSC